MSAPTMPAYLVAAFDQVEADTAFRIRMIDEYRAVCRADDEFGELRLLAEAARYDAAHPGEPVPLVDEMHGTQLRRAA